eukprot:CAMPEP_0174232364 /NCGR_PEP_ID=MMETSP0417-20130205/2670_1 /TAXON_ID=242541 /ORGANISM="Mayorella sp, Strain BSH-02190019" /LENGTH=60 /DNA_ID=CAMNT_0015310401 /DNA_START=31 /DNA_END=210 /DNA_ORIENTATION=-
MDETETTWSVRETNQERKDEHVSSVCVQRARERESERARKRKFPNETAYLGNFFFVGLWK